MSAPQGQSVPDRQTADESEKPSANASTHYTFAVYEFSLIAPHTIPTTRNAQRRERQQLLRQIERVGDLEYVARVEMHDDESAAMHSAIIAALMPRLEALNAALGTGRHADAAVEEERRG